MSQPPPHRRAPPPAPGTMPAGGALLQLVASGRQDVYLTGSPQLTFFKQVVSRHTPYAMEAQRIPVEGTPDFGKLVTVTLPRGADLLHALYLEVELPALQQDAGPSPPNLSYVNGIGHAMIEYVALYIGQQEIDRQTGEWLHMQMQLCTPGAKTIGMYNMVGYQDAFNERTQPGPLRLYVPLRFWFCNNVGLSLPLIALQSVPVRLHIKFRDAAQMVYSDTLATWTAPGGGGSSSSSSSNGKCRGGRYTPSHLPSIKNVTLWGDFVYLSVEERRRFVATEHEYLITQVQAQPRHSVPAAVDRVSIPLTFNHPLSEILWVVQEERTRATNEWFNYSNRQLTEYGTVGDLMEAAVLQLDGYDRFEKRSATYFRLVVPYQRHTAVPNDFLYCYSFSLNPEAQQPMGSLNASRVNSFVLSLDMVTSGGNTACSSEGVELRSHRDCSVAVYAQSYNVLRIAQGLGGLVFTV